MEPQSYARQMQKEMIREIESARPKYAIFANVPTSWMRQPESESLILTWTHQYIKTYYGVVGLVNIVALDRTDYLFSTNARIITAARYLRAHLPTKVVTPVRLSSN